MKPLSKLKRYGLAAISSGVALTVAWPIDAPAPCFLLAAAASSLFGGLGPGLLSIGLSALAFKCLFLRRAIPPAVEPAAFLRFAAFLVASLLIAALIEVKRRVQNARNRTEEALRQANSDLGRVSRVMTMGELTASLAHEVNQPIAAAVTDANTCMRWLTRDAPDLEEAREAASRTIRDATRAAEIISRVGHLFRKGIPQRESVDVNAVIDEMVLILGGEATRYAISVRTDLEADLPRVVGDRVQLQQVVMNLMMNSIDAMRDVNGTRELMIRSQRGENEHVAVWVIDTGVGLPPQHLAQIFNAFFTTKPNGTGMGLRISQSIVESHGGHLWAETNPSRGATFHLTLPTKFAANE
jgi:signal transduction histidine kinase